MKNTDGYVTKGLPSSEIIPNRIFIMLSYDTIFKPMLLYQILLRRREQFCGVAEVRTKTRRQPSNQRLSTFGVWGWKGAIWFGLWTVFNKFCSAFPTPSIIRSTTTIKRVCKLFNIPYILTDDVNEAIFLDQLENIRPDVIVSFQHQIFRTRILGIPRLGCINCHPSKLPHYRGNQPLFWAMGDHQKNYGVTVHLMTQEIDSGKILSQIEGKIENNWTLGDLYKAAYTLAADAIIEGIDQTKNLGNLPRAEIKCSRYYKKPTKEDIQAFKNSGKQII